MKNRNWRDLTPSHECPCFLLIQALCKNQDIRKVIKYWRSKGREINQTFIPVHAKKLELSAHASLILKLFRLTRIVLPPSFIGVSHVIETIIIFFSKLKTLVIMMIKVCITRNSYFADSSTPLNVGMMAQPIPKPIRASDDNSNQSLL